MKRIARILKYIALDGTLFDSELDCKIHDDKLTHEVENLIKYSHNFIFIDLRMNPSYQMINMHYLVEAFNLDGISQLNQIFKIKEIFDTSYDDDGRLVMESSTSNINVPYCLIADDTGYHYYMVNFSDISANIISTTDMILQLEYFNKKLLGGGTNEE